MSKRTSYATPEHVHVWAAYEYEQFDFRVYAEDGDDVGYAGVGCSFSFTVPDKRGHRLKRYCDSVLWAEEIVVLLNAIEKKAQRS